MTGFSVLGSFVIHMLVGTVTVAVPAEIVSRSQPPGHAVSPCKFDESTVSPGHRERPADPPVRRPGERPRVAATSEGMVAVRGSFASVQVNVNAYGENIVGDAANEPSIAVDPTDPSRIVIGWRQFDTIASNFRQAGWAYSRDGGQTWTFPGVLEPNVFSSDPVLGADPDGNFYFYSLQPDRGPGVRNRR